MILISDYDGTLRNGSDGKVDPQDLEFVKKFIDEGNKFIIASGRPYFQLKEYMQELDLKPDYYISNSGTYIFDNQDKMLKSIYLKQKILLQLIGYLSTLKLRDVIFADRHGEYYLFANNPEIKRNPDRKILNLEWKSLEGHQVVCFKILDRPEVLRPLAIYLKTVFGKEIMVVENTGSPLIEIYPANSSKGHAVNYLQELLELPDSEIVVVGDDDNDVVMLDSYVNSFCIRQPYNQRIQSHGTYTITSLWEVEPYLVQTKKIMDSHRKLKTK